MNRVFLVRSAMVTSLGDNLSSTWQGLMDGRSGVAPIRHFDTRATDYKNAAWINSLREGEAENLITSLIRRTIGQLDSIPEDTPVIWTGIKGNVQFIETEGIRSTEFLPRHYREQVSRLTGMHAGGMEINAACASSTVGLALAAQKIRQGIASSVLVCAADLVSRFVHMGFAALKALTAGTCRPFDAGRDGLVLGEGSVALLLCDEKTMQREQLQPLAEICGWGIANDANHITGPARDGIGLILAFQQALSMAGMDADEVQAFSAHGTGTDYNDGMELTALESVFGKRRFPVFSVKGSIGHTLGAAGGIETALSARCLQTGQIPPTVGLREPEERALGRVSPQIQQFAGDNILTSNSGFGGVNAALILRRVNHK